MKTFALELNNIPELPEDIFRSCKAMAKGLAEEEHNESRTQLARSFCTEVIKSFWINLTRRHLCSWDIKTPPQKNYFLNKAAMHIADDMGKIAADIPVLEAGYLIGTLYTVMLSDDTRAKLGAYYTPPLLVHQLLKNVDDSGFNWVTARILDPAGGGAAFLTPVAQKMLMELGAVGVVEPKMLLRHVSTRLFGFEIDAFAAWMSQVILEASLIRLCIAAKKRLPSMVTVGDALRMPVKNTEKFDLVVGNPPYGKIKLDPLLRRRYERSLFGHANMYGLFVDVGMRWLNDNGLIAYVTPTSFLGGQYFKALRSLLVKEAPPMIMDFITERTGVFESVLQETMLTVFKKSPKSNNFTLVRSITPDKYKKALKIETVGRFRISAQKDNPWFLPRTLKQRKLLDRALSMPYRLKDYGFEVNTGPLVWNRHKKQLKGFRGSKSLPLIWAESITPNGQFRFNSIKRSHKSYIDVYPGQNHLITRAPCVLVQRTTAKEQDKRLIATVLPERFLLSNNSGVVIENHVNIIKSIAGQRGISLRTLTTILNSTTVDQIFRCINGSVAVSAYELNALPLPNPSEIAILEQLVRQNVEKSFIEKRISRIYGHR